MKVIVLVAIFCVGCCFSFCNIPQSTGNYGYEKQADSFTKVAELYMDSMMTSKSISEAKMYNKKADYCIDASKRLYAAEVLYLLNKLGKTK